MFEVQPIIPVGTTSYVLDVHQLTDQFLAILMKSSLEENDEFIQQLEDSGGLVTIEHKQQGGTPQPLQEMLYLAKCARDDEREIKWLKEKGDCDVVMSMCPIVSYGNILQEVPKSVKLNHGVDAHSWCLAQCRRGLQDMTIKFHAYQTRDMRIKPKAEE